LMQLRLRKRKIMRLHILDPNSKFNTSLFCGSGLATLTTIITLFSNREAWFK
jgi:hypothetical protein